MDDLLAQCQVPANCTLWHWLFPSDEHHATNGNTTTTKWMLNQCAHSGFDLVVLIAAGGLLLWTGWRSGGRPLTHQIPPWTNIALQWLCVSKLFMCLVTLFTLDWLQMHHKTHDAAKAAIFVFTCVASSFVAAVLFRMAFGRGRVEKRSYYLCLTLTSVLLHTSCLLHLATWLQHNGSKNLLRILISLSMGIQTVLWLSIVMFGGVAVRFSYGLCGFVQEETSVFYDRITEESVNSSAATAPFQLRNDDHQNFLSLLTFWWTNKLPFKGSCGLLRTADDLIPLPRRLRLNNFDGLKPSNTPVELWQWLLTENNSERISPLQLLYALYGRRLILLGVLKFFTDACTFAPPILLHYLLDFVANEKAEAKEGWILAASLVLFSAVAALLSLHYSYLTQCLALQVKTSVQCLLYDKVLATSTADLEGAGITAGHLVNMLTADADMSVYRISNGCQSVHGFASLPVQLTIALLLLYNEIGIAVLAAVVIAIILIPTNKWITDKFGRLTERMMFFKDRRLKRVSELLRGIGSLKLSGDERALGSKIAVERRSEFTFLQRRKYLDAVCVYLWASAPVAIGASVLVTYSALGHVLTAPRVFTTLALVNMLIGPLNAFPWALAGCVQALVSLRRVAKVCSGLRQCDSLDGVMVVDYALRGPIELVNANYGWLNAEQSDTGGGGAQPALTDVTASFPAGVITAVCGPVGCGKSLLLRAIAGELHPLHANQRGGCLLASCARADFVHRGVAYCPQEPWIRRASIRQNILFDAEFDANRYERVIDATAFGPDLARLPSGDRTLVGDSGSTLSGGQRARLALASAIYQKKSIYLLDEPLTALDATVRAHVWQYAIQKLCSGNEPKDTTVILATHDWHCASEASHVIFMDKGTIVASGSPDDVLSRVSIPQLVKHCDMNAGSEVSDVAALDHGEGSVTDGHADLDEKQVGSSMLL